MPAPRQDADVDVSRLKRWADTADRVRSLMTTGILAVGLLAVLGLAAWDSIRNTVVLDLIEVPESLAQKGYTSAVATRELADAIRDIQRESQKVERQRRGQEIDLGLTLADIQIPGGAISISALVRYVRQALRLPERRLSGEITFDDETLKLGTTRLRLVVRGSGALNFTWTGGSEKLDELMKSGAVEIIKNIDPYVAALYYFNTDPKVSLDIIERFCLTRPPANDDPWALTQLGYIYRDQGRYELAIQQFQKAAQDATDRGNRADAHIGWAASLMDRGHYSDALKQLRLAKTSNPDDIYVHVFWAMTLDILGQHRAAREQREMAVKNAKKAIEKHPDYAAAYLNLAWAEDGLNGGGDIAEESVRNIQRAMEFDPAAAHNYWALLLANHNDYRQSIDEYRKVVEGLPRYAGAHVNLGSALLALAETERPRNHSEVRMWRGHYDEAIASFNRALELDATYTGALVHLGYVYETLGHHRDAVQQFEKALRLFERDDDDEGRAQVYLNWGRAFEYLGKHDAAAGKLALAAKADGNNPLIHFWWGSALGNFDRDNPEKAQMAVREYRRVIEIEPAFATVYLQLGDTLVGLKRFNDATAQYQKAVEIDRGADAYGQWAIAIASMASDDQLAADYELAGRKLDEIVQLHLQDQDAKARFAGVYLAWGNRIEENGKHGEAIEKYRRATQLDPEHAAAYEAWGRALGAWSEVEQERDSYLAAVAQIEADSATDGMKPRLAPAYHSWGAFLGERRDHKAAIVKYRKTIEFDVKFTNAYSSWGRALGGIAIDTPEQLESAKAELDGAVPDDTTGAAVFALVHGGLGTSLEEGGKYDEAIEEFRRAIALDSNHVDAYVGWARALYFKGYYLQGLEGDAEHRSKLYDEATKIIERAIDMDPTNPYTYEGWGRMLHELHRYDEAVGKFDLAVELDPAYAFAYEGRGKAYVEMGRTRDAIAQYERAIELAPSQFEGLRNEITRLESEATARGAAPSR